MCQRPPPTASRGPPLFFSRTSTARTSRRPPAATARLGPPYHARQAVGPIWTPRPSSLDTRRAKPYFPHFSSPLCFGKNPSVPSLCSASFPRRSAPLRSLATSLPTLWWRLPPSTIGVLPLAGNQAEASLSSTYTVSTTPPRSILDFEPCLTSLDPYWCCRDTHG
jgi:hypothetical protein